MYLKIKFNRLIFLSSGYNLGVKIKIVFVKLYLATNIVKKPKSFLKRLLIADIFMHALI